MTTSHNEADTECSKLAEFRSFLNGLAQEALGLNSLTTDMRNCVTRSNNETYPVTNAELRAELTHATWNHLQSKRCPRDFQLRLLQTAVAEVELACQQNKECYCAMPATEQHNDDKLAADKCYDASKLQRYAASVLDKLLLRLADNVEAQNLQNYAAPGALCQGGNCSCKTDLCGSSRHMVATLKNKPRKMEDRHCCWDNYSAVYDLSPTSYSFYGVFDGHSGPLAAAYAAAQLPELCAQQLRQAQIFDKSTHAAALRQAFLAADERFCQKRLSGGTTAVCVLLERSASAAVSNLHVAWVGDSCAMLISKQRCRPLVRPHKPDCLTERERIEAHGAGAIMFVQGHWRVNGILNVSRSIGDFSFSNVVVADPDFEFVQLQADDDFLVLGTDGLWDHASEADVASTIYDCLVDNAVSFANDVPKKLIELAKRGDSQDNITVVVVLLREPTQILKELQRERAEGEL